MFFLFLFFFFLRGVRLDPPPGPFFLCGEVSVWTPPLPVCFWESAWTPPLAVEALRASAKKISSKRGNSPARKCKTAPAGTASGQVEEEEEFVAVLLPAGWSRCCGGREGHHSPPRVELHPAPPAAVGISSTLKKLAVGVSEW